MDDKEANDIRCFAGDMIAKLHAAGRRDELNMIAIQARRCVELIDEKNPPPSEPSGVDAWAPV